MAIKFSTFESDPTLNKFLTFERFQECHNACVHENDEKWCPYSNIRPYDY